MGLVDDQVLPREAAEYPPLRIRHLVRRHAHVPRAGIVRIVVLHLPRLLVKDLRRGTASVVRGGLVGEVLLREGLALLLPPVKADGAQGGTPAVELVHPVGERGLRHADEVRPLDFHVLEMVRQNGNGLKGFAESHLVGKNAIQPLLGQVDHPIQTLQLVGLQLPELDARGLLCQEPVSLAPLILVVIIIVFTIDDAGVGYSELILVILIVANGITEQYIV
mmetsp:Transcript_35503/g.85663  ORF Transcript_35503/g.85663 Transcript_35503/m.85663 type:complete len:221 (+) Transcript_35503:103-765(+)